MLIYTVLKVCHEHNILESTVFHPLRNLPLRHKDAFLYHKGAHSTLYLVNNLLNMVNELLVSLPEMWCWLLFYSCLETTVQGASLSRKLLGIHHD
jgi:hypothetical protein